MESCSCENCKCWGGRILGVGLSGLWVIISIITCLMGNFLLSMLVAVLSIHVYFNNDDSSYLEAQLNNRFAFIDLDFLSGFNSNN